MDVLCTDKTGTLTQDKIILKEHLNIEGAEDPRVLKYAYLNSFHQTGLKNLLDHAVLEHYELEHEVIYGGGGLNSSGPAAVAPGSAGTALDPPRIT